MKNQEVSRIFREIAQMLELKGENPFRIRAYERAAQNIESLGEDLEAILKRDSLTSLPGIGVDLANKIKEIIATGRLKHYEELKKKIPAGLLEMLEIPGLGPKTVKLILDELKICTIEKLKEAARKGRLSKLEGIREKTEENILRGIELLKMSRDRTPLYSALDIACSFTNSLREIKQIERIEVAGSLRRRKETVRDIDILVISRKPKLVMERFTQLAEVKEILAKGETKSSVIAKENNIQVDLRVVGRRSFGSALMYFTGSKEFNIKLRQLAIKRRFKVNEYGIFSLPTKSQNKEQRKGGEREKDIFSLLGMEYIPPELREDRGEIEASLARRLPRIVNFKDIKGDLHVHSRYSDGAATIEEIAQAAERFNYEYVAICDHSQSLKVAGGLSIREVHAKIEHIRRLNKKKKVALLCGTEVDISGEGKLDYPDSVLKEFDLVVAAVHSGFKQSRKQLTKRIVAACKNKYVDIIAHPTGKLWGVRDPYDIDLDEICRAAAEHKVCLEINSYPQRLDLNDSRCLQVKHAGAKLALGTDAHILQQFSHMELGVSIARRGWLEKEDIINCFSLDKLLNWLRK